MLNCLFIFKVLTDFATVSLEVTVEPHIFKRLQSKSVKRFENRFFTAKWAFHQILAAVPLFQTTIAECSFTFRALSRLRDDLEAYFANEIVIYFAPM